MIKIKTIPVGMIMTNCYIITDEKTKFSAVIDPGEFTPALEDALNPIGFDTIKYIILTHGHYDHIGGVEDILKRSNAQVAVSFRETSLLNDANDNLAMTFVGKPLADIPCDITLSEGDIITLGESSLTVMLTPGHTFGSICLIGDGVIFSGDTLFYGSYGRTDFPTGSSAQLASSLKRLSELDGSYKVYPGHGDMTTLAFEKKNNPGMNGLNYEDLY